MRILFLMRNHGAIAHYESTLRALAERGHQIVIGSRGAERHYAADMNAPMDRLCRDYGTVTVQRLPRRSDEWMALAESARAVRNYCRYLHPRYAAAVKLRERAAQQVFKNAGLARVPRRRVTGAAVSAAASLVERLIPGDPAIEQAIAGISPDVVVTTPLVDFNSYQPDYVNAAARLRIPTVWCVASWDNLSNKGVASRIPDRVLVWNEAQRREAIELQGVPAERVVLTGAQTFDPWFTLSPATPRESFTDLLGLGPGPFLLYLCSSVFVAPDEVGFLRQWLSRLRSSEDEMLRGCGVLIRPHPANAAQFTGVDFSAWGPVSVWPPAGDLPLEASSKQRYYDSLYHSVAVVGVNSSGMIEAGIVGRRSYTLLAPEFRDTQRGTIHFEYLLSYRFVTAARTWPEHLADLAAAIRGQSPIDVQTRRRMMEFVRPAGEDQPSTPRVAAAIEDAGRLVMRHVPAQAPALVQRALMPLARAAARRRTAARAAAREARPAVLRG
jgi:hypothetical protein